VTIIVLALWLTKKLKVVVNSQGYQIRYTSNDKVLVFYFIWVFLEASLIPCVIDSFIMIDDNFASNYLLCLPKRFFKQTACIISDINETSVKIYTLSIVYTVFVCLSNLMTGYFVWFLCKQRHSMHKLMNGLSNDVPTVYDECDEDRMR
jgi:hypothetical protein